MKLCVIGLGLIGGSLARAAVKAGYDVTGYDPDPRQRQAASLLGDFSPQESLQKAVQSADVIVLAVPVLQTRKVFEQVHQHRPLHAVVSDVGSTKQSVLEDVQAVAGSVPSWFVAAHPIAGTEKSGMLASNPDLFRNKRLILCPHDEQDATALEAVRRLWLAVGARINEMSASEHDRIFAATSHLPHVLAFAFVESLSHHPEAAAIFSNAGGGFRDFTRIASSNPQMWHDIIRANQADVLALLEQQLNDLQHLASLIEGQQWAEVKACFERAQFARERYLGQIE